jgi:hypothetical protein
MKRSSKLITGAELLQLTTRLRSQGRFIAVLDVWGAHYEVKSIQWLPGHKPGQMELFPEGKSGRPWRAATNRRPRRFAPTLTGRNA